MRTSLLVVLLLCTGACAHTQAQTPNTAVVSSTSQDEADTCVRDDDSGDEAPCPVKGAPEEITRMTSLLQSQNDTVTTADSTPSQMDSVDTSTPARTQVAEDAP